MAVMTGMTVWAIFYGYLTNRMCFSVVCTLIDNETRHYSGQNVVDTRRSRMSPQQILTTVMTRIVVDKSKDHAKLHSICFFYHNIKDN